MSIRFFLFVALVLPFGLAMGQNSIKGTIKDATTLEGIIGATISVKNTNTGTITDFDGNFQLDVNQGSILIISYVGYQSKEIIVTADRDYEILINSESVLLDQIVVVGYGTQRKVDVTGSTVSVKGEDLLKQPVMTATQALQGRVAGVQIISSGRPGASPNVRIRGTGTALAGTTAFLW